MADDKYPTIAELDVRLKKLEQAMEMVASYIFQVEDDADAMAEAAAGDPNLMDKLRALMGEHGIEVPGFKKPS